MRAAAALALTLSLVTLGACSAEAAPPSGPGSTHGDTHGAPPAPAAPTAPPAALPAGPRGVVLARYEALRAVLADDKGAAIAAELPALRTAVTAIAADKAAGAADLQKGLDGLAAATATKDGAAVDLKAARVAFGELSRGLVAAIAADPALQAGRFLFECPMAAGYQRWVQTNATMANPYMGRRMLECGAAVAAWRVEG